MEATASEGTASEGTATAIDSNAGGVTDTTTVDNTAAATQEKGWLEGLSEDMKGYAEVKGFKDPSSVIESYKNLEKLMGAPKDKLLKMPETDDEAGMNEFYNRLGRPENKDGYEFKMPEGFQDGESFSGWAKDAFYKLGLTKDQAAGLMESYGEYFADQNKTMIDGYNQKLADQEYALKQEWGMAYDKHVQQAKSAVNQLEITADQVNALEQVLGFDGVMKMMQNFGAKVGEDKFVGSEGTPENVLSPASAKSRISELIKDRTFQEKMRNGDAKAKAEWNNLHKMASPGTMDI